MIYLLHFLCTSMSMMLLCSRSYLYNQSSHLFYSWKSTRSVNGHLTKTKEFIISFVKDPKLLDPLTVNSLHLESINTTKLLGVHLLSDLKWSTHVEAVCAKASRRLFALRSLKRSGISRRDLRSVYSYFIRPVLEYACPV